jgi:hypothetical protein
MSTDEQERIHILCERIATEQDQEKFVKLVQELNDLLDRKDPDRENPDHETPDRKNLDRKNRRIDPPARTSGSNSTV